MNKTGEKITKDVSAEEIKKDGGKTILNFLAIAGKLTAAALVFGIVATDARLGNDNEGYSDLSLTERADFVAKALSANADQVLTGDSSARNAVADQIQHSVRKSGPKVDF